MRLTSLKRQLAQWLIGVLSALLLADAWVSYREALHAANQAYDRSLSASLKGIAERVYATDKEVVVDIPYSALELFEAGSDDRVFYSVGWAGEEAAITGYDQLPLPTRLQTNVPVFYDGEYKGQPLRLGALQKPLYRTEFPRPVVVIFAETTHSRQEVVSTLFWREFGRKALFLLVALAVALLATRQAVKPVERLGRAIRARPEEDLTPIDAPDIPREVAPLVEAINLHMGRIDRMLEARRRFITDAAHQLRTPLAVLNTQAEYALRQHDINEMRPAITALHHSLGSAIRLTNQLLALSRAESINGLMAGRQPVDLAALAQETVIELLPLAAERGIDLGFDGRATPTVPGNPVLLREMITNLIDNALRYTPRGGMVTVRVTTVAAPPVPPPPTEEALSELPWTPPQPQLACLTVLDNGPGIPADQRELVFLRFLRLNSSDTVGSGLGLSIVKEIVLGHDGQIELEDGEQGGEQQRGLAAVVTLPQAN
jgi:two-component system sensor histidine kinase TctE